MPRQRAVPSKSTAHDDTENPQPQLADYYRWEEPDRRIRIYINFETADRLQVQVFGGIDAFLDGGVEVGGILLGRTETEFDGGWITTVIDDFQSVPCSYSNGPLYSLNGAEAVLFKSTLARCKSDTSSGLSVVGYYRSHRRDDLYLSADDLTLIQGVFPGPDNVFLLIKPLPMRACTVGFFFWEDGKVQSEFTLEVPFAPIRSLSASPEEDPAEDLLTLLPARLDLSVNLTTIPPRESMGPVLPRHDRWHGRARDVAAAALGITLSLAVFAYWQVRRSEMARLAPAAHDATSSSGLPSSRPPTLNLWASDQDGQVRIRWNRDAEPVMSAEKASLFIVDGDRKLETTLSRELLHNGSVLYQRKSPDLEIRLLVKGAVPVQEMTRLIGLSGPAAVAVERQEAADAVRLTVARGPKVQPVEKPRHIPTLAASVIPVVTPLRIPPPAPKATALYRGLVELFGDWLPFSVYRGPMTGRLIWTGTLAAGGDLRIDGDRASTGYITGRMPKAPIRVSVHPANFSRGSINVYTRELPAGKEINEQPSPSKGWTRTVYNRNPARADDVLLIEPPSAQNNWNRIAVRAGNRTVSVLVVDWEVISHEP